jgi:hypothetical protein
MQNTQIVSRLIRLLPRPVRTHAHVHPHTELAAEAADDQGKFWQVHDLLLANQENLQADDAAGCSGGVANIRSEPAGVSPALGPVPAIYVPRPSRREESR